MKADVKLEDKAEARPGLLPLFAAAAFAGFAAAFLFVGFPQLDIAISRLFFTENGAFIFNYPGVGQTVRAFFRWLFFGAGLTVFAGVVLAAFFQRHLFRLGFPQWLFLGLCLAIGPGVAANAVLKDNWGRARPFHVQEFGGGQEFTPVLMHSDQCLYNCSFVSGEASAIYMLFFALALLARRRRAALLLAGVLGGTAAGVVRMAQGGHFLSDVIFSAVFMLLIALGLYWVIFRAAPEWFAEQGRLHRAVLAGGSTITSRITGRGPRKP